MGPSTTGPPRPARICRKQMQKPRALMPTRVSPAARRSSAKQRGSDLLLRSLPLCPFPPNRKAGAAASPHPNPPVIVAPGLALDTRRATALVSESHAAAGIHRTVIAFSIIRRAGDGCHVRTTGSARPPRAVPGAAATPQIKIRPAPTIHPDTPPAVPPGLSLDARRAAALIYQPYPAAGVDPARMPLHVVGGTGHLSPVLLSDSALGQRSRSEGHSLDAQQQNKPHPFLHRQLSLKRLVTSEARPRCNLVQAMI